MHKKNFFSLAFLLTSVYTDTLHGAAAHEESQEEEILCTEITELTRKLVETIEKTQETSLS